MCQRGSDHCWQALAGLGLLFLTQKLQKDAKGLHWIWNHGKAVGKHKGNYVEFGPQIYGSSAADMVDDRISMT